MVSGGAMRQTASIPPVRLTLSRSAELMALMDEWRKDGSVPVDRLDPEDPLGWLVKDGVDSVIAAGYKFAASHPAISTVITGTSNVQHLDSNAAAAAGPPLSSQDYARLVEIFGNSAAPK
jgi:L-galactose dehydrogenase